MFAVVCLGLEPAKTVIAAKRLDAGSPQRMRWIDVIYVLRTTYVPCMYHACTEYLRSSTPKCDLGGSWDQG